MKKNLLNFSFSHLSRLVLSFFLVMMMSMGVSWGQTTVTYGWETTDDASLWTISNDITATSGQGNTGNYAGKISTNSTVVQFNEKVFVTSFSFALKRTSNNNNYSCYIETSTDGTTWELKTEGTYAMNTFSNGSYTTQTRTFDGTQELYVRFRCNNTTAVRYVDDVTITYNTSGGTPTPTTYTVTYSCDGGTGCPGTSTATAGSSITLASAPTKTNYNFDGWSDGTTTYQAEASYTVDSNVTFTAQWTAQSSGDEQTLIFDFEDEGAHRPNTSNSYTGTNTYSENNVDISLTYADAITTGTPINGSANVLGRIAKNTTNNPEVLIGPIDISNWTISKIEYKTKGVAAMSQVFATSLDNSTWTTQLNLSAMPTQTTTETINNLSITGAQLYLKWTVSVSSSTGSNRDFYLDDIVITYTTSSNPSPSISANNVDIAYDAANGSIAYTINNEPTPAGTLTAAIVQGGTIANLTLGTIENNTIPFTCDANNINSTRTSTLTLTYTYNTNETITKDVTITQAAAPVIYTTIPDLFAAATSSEEAVLVTFNNWVVSGVSSNGKNVFVTDNNGNGFVIYSNNDMSSTYSVGNILSGTAISCKLKKYNGFAELLNVNADDLTIATGGTVTTANIAMSNLAGVNTGALVHYDNLTCSVDNNKYYLSDGTTSIQVYNSLYAFDALEDGRVYNITGVYQQFNNTKEILPRSAADIVKVVNPSCSIDPTSWNFGEVEVGTATSKTFTVTTSDLASALSIYFIDNNYYTTNVSTIAATATTTTITVTLNPTIAGAMEDFMIIYGEGMEDIEVPLTATGIISSYTVTATANPTIGGNVEGAGTYDNGTQISLRAIANDGYDFTGWYNSTELVSSDNPFTFNVSADTTLEAHFTKRYTVSFNAGTGTYTGSDITEANAMAGITLPSASICQTLEGYAFAGWATAAVSNATTEVPTLFTTGSDYYPTQDITLYAVYSATANNNNNNNSQTESSYIKVTSTPNDWSGDYLIVYEDIAVAFDGSLATLDAASNTIDVTITNNSIIADATTNAAKFTISAIDGGYSILSASGKYIGQTSNDNGLQATDNAILNNISLDGENTDIVSSNAHLRFNIASNQARFRYYKSGSYTNQQAIQLYKYVAGTSGSTTTYYSYPACAYTVTIANTIANGTVTANPTTATFGTIIALTANPTIGYHFNAWDVQTDGGTAVNVNNNNEFEMPEDNVTVSASFTINSYTVTATAEPSNGGSVTGTNFVSGESYDYGTELSLTATHATGYNFVNWTENGSEVSTSTTYNFTVEEARNLVANFELSSYTVTATANPSNGGSVTGTNFVSGESYDYGTELSLTATPATGYYFVNWTENGSEVSTSTTYNFTVEDAKTLVANFELSSYTVTATANPSNGGSVTGTNFVSGESYDYGTELSLTATANTGFTFFNWTKDGAVVSTNATYTFTVTEAGNYVANFAYLADSISIDVNYHPDSTDVNSDYVKVQWDFYLPVEDFETGDFSKLSWQLDPNYPWEITTTNPYEGIYCMKSGNVGIHSSSSSMSITINYPNQGTISFVSKISSESNWDYGYFYIDGEEKLKASGTSDWRKKQFTIEAGVHTFTWIYQKDGLENSNDDCYYIDSICFNLIPKTTCLDSHWHTYCESEFNNAVGSNIGIENWAYEYPISKTSLYAGLTLTKVSLFSDNLYSAVGGNYTCTIYIGGDNPTAGTAVSTITVDMPSNLNAWVDFDLETPVTVSGTEPLWVVWTANTKSSSWPAGCCDGLVDQGTWWDGGEGWEHLTYGTWTMRQYFEIGNNIVQCSTPDKVCGNDIHYRVYRTLCSSSNYTLIADNLTKQELVDSTWSTLTGGSYKYGIGIVEDASRPIQWSNCIVNNNISIDCPDVQDVDGHLYHSVQIGSKCWMNENLRTTHYADGRPITNIYKYQCPEYPNAENNATTFGLLYDWYDALDSNITRTRAIYKQGICPTGWHIPSDDEFEELININLQTVRSTDYWLYNAGDNATGFDLRPAGMYSYNSARYENLLGNTYLWSATSLSTTTARCYAADCNCYLIYELTSAKTNAYSVRCVKDF